MQRITLMLALVVAGELIFGLPFNVPRFFRRLCWKYLGSPILSSGYVCSLWFDSDARVFSGWYAGRPFSARSLIALSLFATAIGGFYMATIPSETVMPYLYGYWGLTTIFLFWGALIRATREWGGEQSQGVAFGVLDGGRGLVAASVAAIGVTVLSIYLPDNARLATPEEREAGLRSVIWLYCALTIAAGILAWFAIPAGKKGTDVEFNPLKGMATVLRRPIIWAQAAIIICAYCGYKGLDNYSLYAVQVLGMDEVEGARLASYGAWTRPVAAICAGLIADRFNVIRSITSMFFVLAVSFGVWSTLAPAESGLGLIYANFFLTYVFVYALRGIYFALLSESRTPKHLTGAAVGMISLVGYTPDMFFAPIAGRILDANPGLVGHQNYFMFLAAIAAVGILAVSWLIWLQRKGSADLWREADSQLK